MPEIQKFLVKREGESGFSLLRPIEVEKDDPHFAIIPHGSFRVAADGSVSFDALPEEEGDLLPRHVIASRGCDAEKLRGVTMNGDALLPRIADGDTIIVDTGNTKPEHLGVFVLKVAGEVRVLRLQRVAGCWMARQDVPLMTPEFEVTEADIIGRVIYMFGVAQP